MISFNNIYIFIYAIILVRSLYFTLKYNINNHINKITNPIE